MLMACPVRATIILAFISGISGRRMRPCGVLSGDLRNGLRTLHSREEVAEHKNGKRNVVNPITQWIEISACHSDRYRETSPLPRIRFTAAGSNFITPSIPKKFLNFQTIPENRRIFTIVDFLLSSQQTNFRFTINSYVGELIDDQETFCP